MSRYDTKMEIAALRDAMEEYRSELKNMRMHIEDLKAVIRSINRDELPRKKNGKRN